MLNPSNPGATIEEQLSYWKWDFTATDLFSGELAYSLIFDNIRPDRLSSALATVGLDALPNYFLLIQIDDYLTLSKQLEITREFFQKDLVVNTIRTYLQQLHIPGFAANLINTDRVICFLCLDESAGPSASSFFQGFIGEIRRRVRLHTSYTLSVSVSTRCTGLSHFPKQYTLMGCALDRSFYHGQGAYLDAGDTQNTSACPVDQAHHYTSLLAAISQGDQPRILRLTQALFQQLKDAQLPPQQVRIEIVRLIHRLESYCLDCAVPERAVCPLSQHCNEGVLASQFFDHIQSMFLTFCEQAASVLARYGSSYEYQFKTPVQAYIGEHYSRSIRLEEIAQAFGFSPGYFTQVFKRRFGITLTQYLQQYRVEKGKELLSQSVIPIEQIAFQVGFNSYNYFCTTFKRLTGMTPKEYRISTGCRREDGRQTP